MQLQIGTKLTIQEIDAVKSEINSSLKKHGSLEVVTPEPINEIDLTGIQLLISLNQSNIIVLKISVEENQLQNLNDLGFDLGFIN